MKYLVFILSLLYCFTLFALTQTDRQEESVPNFYFPNAGFENGIKDITVSSATKTWSTTKYLGNKALKCALDTAGDYCETKLVANPGAAANLEWGFHYYVTNANVKADIIDGSGNVVRTKNPLASNTGYTEKILEFVGAASTSYKLRWTALGAADIYIDTMKLSKNTNVGSVNLNVKSAIIAGGTLGTVCSSSPCTVYNQSTDWITSATRPGLGSFYVNINSGIYSVVPNCNITTGTNSGAYQCAYNINSSTTTQLLVQCKDNSGNDIDVVFSIVCHDPTSEDKQVVRAENANQFAATVWRTNNAASITAGSFTNFNISSGDSARTNYGKAQNQATANDVALKILSLEPKGYLVNFSGVFRTTKSTINTGCEYAITDGTTTRIIAVDIASDVSAYFFKTGNSAYFEYTSIGDRTFTVQGRRTNGDGSCRIASYELSGQIDTMLSVNPVYPTSNMPQIVNSVGTTYNGQTKLESVFFAGASRATACSGSPCTMYNNTGGFSSITRSGTGTYVVNFTSGTWSQIPTCTCSIDYRAGASFICYVYNTGLTSTTVYTSDNTVTGSADTGANIICHGLK